MLKVLLIFLGGGTGAVLRYGVQAGVLRYTGPAFPWGTLAANVIGCLLIGALATALPTDRLELRLALVVGLLGGFTTFSSFSHETLTLAQRGDVGLAVIYVLVSNGLGLAAAAIGWLLATTLRPV